MNLRDAWIGFAVLRQRLRDQRGYSTEAIVITAALAALAIIVAAIITVKVVSQANAIQTH